MRRYLFLIAICALTGCGGVRQLSIETTAFYGGNGPPIVQTTVRQTMQW
jgi:uncharacterized protein YceK